MKDIFIDNCIIKFVKTPVDEKYKLFVTWLNTEGALVTSNKLIQEYYSGDNTLQVIIDRLTREGRINKIKNDELKRFNFTKTQINSLRSKSNDLEHLKAVLLSYRKIAISIDTNFIHDINNYPKLERIKPTAADCPTKINYK
jgi:hypothetical protein